LPDRSFAITGIPGADYWIHQHDLPVPVSIRRKTTGYSTITRETGEFGLSMGAPVCAVKGFHLSVPSLCGMTYYSCHDLFKIFAIITL